MSKLIVHVFKNSRFRRKKYIKMPNWIQDIHEEEDDLYDCVVLDKELYSLVQGARKFLKN